MNYEILSIDTAEELEKLIRENGSLREERNKLEEKINKAIDYIEKYETFQIIHFADGTVLDEMRKLTKKDLLNILKEEV